MTAYLAWTNYTKTGVLTDGSHATGMAAVELQYDSGSPSAAWQTAFGVLTSAAGATFTCTFAAPASACRVFGIFRSNLTSSASVTFALWSNTGGAHVVYTVTLSGPSTGFGQVVACAPSDQVGDYWVVSINNPGNPDGFINVPLAFVGPAWPMVIGPDWASTMGRDDLTDEMVSRGGQEYPTPRWNRRRWEIALDGVTGTELYAQLVQVDRISRAGGNVLFVPSSSSATLQQEAIFGRLKATADVSYPYQSGNARAWRGRLTERI